MAQEMCVEMEGAEMEGVQEFGLCGLEMGVLQRYTWSGEETYITDVLAAVSLWLVHQSKCRFESTEAR